MVEHNRATIASAGSLAAYLCESPSVDAISSFPEGPLHVEAMTQGLGASSADPCTIVLEVAWLPAVLVTPRRWPPHLGMQCAQPVQPFVPPNSAAPT